MANVSTNHTSANVTVATENGKVTTQRPLIIDATPTANSPHAVSSGGTKKYVDDTIKDAETKIDAAVTTVTNLSERVDDVLETAEEAAEIASEAAAVVEEVKEEAEAFKTHIQNKNNPHEVTTAQIGAVPFRIRTLPSIQQTSGFRSRASVYVDDNGTNTQMTLQAIKDMNTKIISVDTESDINFAQVDKGDYIYIKSEQETE